MPKSRAELMDLSDVMVGKASGEYEQIQGLIWQ